ncbi:DUF2691 family protein [Clostridium sp. UBA5119]|uniref:DUF2691 family protein n=1 Tax=Clostridium sp. UBA5119 TaxID=1946366 RepID=UPI0032164762
MIRGLRFKIPNEYNFFINKITDGINKDTYVWEIFEDQVFVEKGDFLFDSDIYSGQKFNEIISQSPYYATALNLQVFPCETNIQQVKNYNEFLSSNCELVFLICDVIFVDIYSKSMKIIEIIRLNAQNNNFQEIEYITDENDRIKEFDNYL